MQLSKRQFSSFYFEGCRHNWSKTPKLGTVGSQGAWMTPYKDDSPQSLVVSLVLDPFWSNGNLRTYVLRREIRRKTGHVASSLSRSLKVIGSDKDRSRTYVYDFLLTSRSDHDPMLYRFQILSITVNFFPPKRLRRRDIPWNWITPDGTEKLDWRG